MYSRYPPIDQPALPEDEAMLFGIEGNFMGSAAFLPVPGSTEQALDQLMLHQRGLTIFHIPNLHPIIQNTLWQNRYQRTHLANPWQPLRVN